MKATAVADLHAGGRRVFFDIAAERLLTDRQIGGGALQVEQVRGSPSLANSLALSSLQICFSESFDLFFRLHFLHCAALAAFMLRAARAFGVGC
jgi:hypothetical protein